MPLDTGISQFRAGFQRFCVGGINPVAGPCKGLLWGYMHDPSSPPEASSFADTDLAATPNQPVQVLSPTHADELFGQDSQLAAACHLYFAQCGGYLGNGALFAVPVLDDSEATAAAYTITFTGDATAAGEINFRIWDHITGNTSGYYSVAVASGDTATEMATAVAAEINADPRALYIATSALGVVTLTGKHAGTILNNMVLTFNTQWGERLPAGVTAAFTQTVTGAGDADFSTALGNLSSCPYSCWGLLTEDATARALIVGELETRWSCGNEQTYGHLFSSVSAANASALVTALNSTNNETRTPIPVLNSYKYSGWLLTAAWVGRVCCSVCENPARPVQRDNGVLELLEDSSPCETAIFSPHEKEQIVAAGGAMWGFNASGSVFITQNVTNWKFNVNGDRDRTWENVESRYMVPALVGVIERYNNKYYSSSALVNDGTPIPEGSRTTSPSLYRAHLISYLEKGEDEDPIASGVLGTILDDADLNNDIQVARNTDGAVPGYGDCHRLDVLITARLVAQLRHIATKINVRPC